MSISSLPAYLGVLWHVLKVKQPLHIGIHVAFEGWIAHENEGVRTFGSFAGRASAADDSMVDFQRGDRNLAQSAGIQGGKR